MCFKNLTLHHRAQDPIITLIRKAFFEPIAGRWGRATLWFKVNAPHLLQCSELKPYEVYNLCCVNCIEKSENK